MSNDHIQTEDMSYISVHRKSRKCVQKFRRTWETYPEFRDWLRPVKGDELRAQCVACKTRLRADITVIKNHSRGIKHTAKMKEFYDDPDLLASLRRNMKQERTDQGFVAIEEQNTDAEGHYLELEDYTIAEPDDDMKDRSIPQSFQYINKQQKPNNYFHSNYSPNKVAFHHPQSPPRSIVVHPPPEDEFDVFGKHIAVELRHLTDEYTRQSAKMKISTILYESRISLLKKTTSHINVVFGEPTHHHDPTQGHVE